MKKLLLILLPLAVVCGCGKIDLSDGGNSQKKRYKVGDFYSDNNKEGIVISITNGGLHGKIVSEDETECEWSTENAYTGAEDQNDGMANMKKIQAISGWHEKYPAFAWCADKGDGWYLPALNELTTMYDSKVVKSGWYWSSTEYNYLCAWRVVMNYGGTDSLNKDYGNYVRAVSAF